MMIRPGNLFKGKARQGIVRQEDTLLTIDLPLSNRDQAHLGLVMDAPWRVLEIQSAAWRWDKVLRPVGEGPPSLRRERPFAPDTERPEAVVEQALQQMETALHDPDPPHKAREEFTPDQASLLEEALAESAWSHRRDGDGAWAFRVDTDRRRAPHKPYLFRATLTPHPHLGLRAAVVLPTGVDLDDDRRQMVGDLLLEAGRRLKRARGFARQDGEGVAIGIEVFQDWPLGRSDLDLLLGTLAVACDLVGPDIEELCRGAAASRYRQAFGIARTAGARPKKGAMKARD